MVFIAAPLRADQALPPLARDVRIDQRLNEQLPPDLEFRDEMGHKVRLGQFFDGRPHILTLVYFSCPKLCTLVLNGLRDALQATPGFDVGKQFNIITVSFDPRESPPMAAEKKKNYVASYGREGAEAGWHFLVGSQASIDRLTDAAGFRYAYDPKLDQFIHAATIIILTPEGRISRYLYGVKFAPKDLRLALVEASDRKIGSPIDQVLLLCYHYDPAAGKYTASVMNFVRAGGVLTILALAVFGLAMWRRERVRAGATAGLSSSAEDTVGQANRGTQPTCPESSPRPLGEGPGVRASGDNGNCDDNPKTTRPHPNPLTQGEGTDASRSPEDRATG